MSYTPRRRNEEMPWPLWWLSMRQVRPTTQEQVQVGIVSEFLIPLLQGLGVAFCVIIASLTSLAALDSWGIERSERLIVALFGFAVIVSVLLITRQLPASDDPLRSFGLAVAIVLPVVLGLAVVVYNLPHILDGRFALQLFRTFLVVAGYLFILAVELSVILKTNNVKAGVFFLPLTIIPVGAAWWFLVAWVTSYWWPVVSSIIALGLDAFAGLLIFSFSRELINRWLPLPPHERWAMEVLERMFPEEGEGPQTGVGPVLVYADRDRRSEAERLYQRLQEFVRAAWSGTTRQRLLNIGFKANEIQKFRDLLIGAGAARWNDPRAQMNPSYHHFGWSFIDESPERTLDRIVLYMEQEEQERQTPTTPPPLP